MNPLILGAGLLGGALLLPRLARASGGGTGGGAELASGSIEELMAEWEGKRLGDTPAGVVRRLNAHAAALVAPPAKVGHLAWLLIGAERGRAFPPIVVRRNAAERERDLAAWRGDWTKAPPEYVWTRIEAVGQKDYALERALGGVVKAGTKFIGIG